MRRRSASTISLPKQVVPPSLCGIGFCCGSAIRRSPLPRVLRRPNPGCDHDPARCGIDSNLVAAAVLLIGAAVRQRSRTLDLLRGAAVVYMVVVGVVFTLLLSGTDVDTAIPWVNTVVHELMPMVMVADWLLDPPAHRLSLRQSLLWLSFPFVWILYTLVRGAITGRYPYPFLNPTNGGYGSVAAYSAAIFVLLMVVCAVVVWIGNAPRPSGLLPSPGS